LPANSKYLTSSPVQRAIRLLTGFVGGYLVTTLLHLIAAAYISKSVILITFTFSGFIIWAVLFIVAYIPKKAWQASLTYFGVTGVLALILFFTNTYNSVLS
tara:strand:- start:1112 stop:1414 length:303 start_codon:yes stop_codon:yes gene_type:complete